MRVMKNIDGRIGALALIVLAFAALTILVTFPIILQLDSSLAQNSEWGHDAFHHAYVMWWFKKALLEFRTNPADLFLINYPAGGHYPLLLTYSTVYLAGLPLSIILPPAAAYNVLFMLTFLFSALTGYALCAYLTGSRWGGFMGGIVYAFFPGRVAHAFAGHLELISTYLFPLYLLLLIKTIDRPRPVTVLLCGLSLGASLLVQPMFIPFLLVPVTMGCLLNEMCISRKRLDRRIAAALIGTFVIATLLALPFFWPALREQVLGLGGYLEESGTITFSASVLGMVSPSPLNPALARLGLVPAFARQVVPVDVRMAELLVYVGLVPLGLAALGFLSAKKKMGVWLTLALLAAVLSLGPLLWLGDELVTITVDEYKGHVPLPYALLMNLPLISYSRAPARLNITLMLMVAILSAHGLTWLLAHVSGRWRQTIALAVYGLAVVEFLVTWPCPTTPLQPAAAFAEIERNDTFGAVLNLPLSWPANEQGLFYQISHERPILAGWVQRSLPAETGAAEFLDALFAPPRGQDIIPAPSAQSRALAAREMGVGHVLLFKHATEDAAAREPLLSAALGAPSFGNDELAIFLVPPGETPTQEIIYGLPESTDGKGWMTVETWDGQPARWLSQAAELYLYSPGEQAGVLRFKALPFSNLVRIQTTVNDVELPPVLISDWITYSTPVFTLRPGLNVVSFHSVDGCANTTVDPRCMGVARAAGAACDPYLHWDRCLSALFQDIQFVGTPAGPAAYPLELDVGEHLHFLGYDLDGSPAAGHPLMVTLYWQVLSPSRQELVIFIHLLGANNQLLAQSDASPLQGLYPADKWVPGDVFLHRASLAIPADAQPGEYELVSGVYTFPDLARQVVVSDRPWAQDGLVWLQSVVVR